MSDWIDEIYPRHLKNAGSKAIQDAITKALTELTGEEYKVSVDLINFESNISSYEYDETKINITAIRVKDHLAEKTSQNRKTAQ